MEVLVYDEPAAALREGRLHQEVGDLALELLSFHVRLLGKLDGQECARDPLAALPGSFGSSAQEIRDLRSNDVRRIRLADPRTLPDHTPVLRVGLHRVVGHAVPETPPPIVLGFEIGPQLARLLDQTALPDPRL